MSELSASPSFNQMASIGAGEGVRVRLLAPSIVSVLARKGQHLPYINGPRQTLIDGVTALGIGPGRWLVLDASPEQLATLGDAASLSNHSDGYAVFEIWGPQVRAALCKGVPVDLHPSVFTDNVAVTVIAHVGAIVWQIAPDRFAIAVFRSYAGSFWHWLSASAAEFGLRVENGA